MLTRMPSMRAVFAVALTACSDAGVTKFNTDPTAEISSHAAGDTVREGYEETLRGTVGDANHGVDQLTVSWLVDGSPVCLDAAPDSEGLVTCDHTFLPTGGEVVLEVRDPEGGSGSARVTVDVQPTDAPLAEITAPTATGVYYAEQLTTLEGLVSDEEDAPTELSVVWESTLDGVLVGGIDTPDSEGSLLGAVTLLEGEHFLTLTVTDTTGKEGRDSVTFQVGPPNSSPNCAITGPASGEAGADGELVTFTAEVGDVDVAADWLTVEWTSDKDDLLGTSTANTDGGVTFPYSDLSVNTHVVTMTVTDEVGATCSADVVYSVGTPPVLTVTAPVDGDVFNETEGVDFTGTAIDDEDLETDIALSWTSDVDGEFATDGADSDGDIDFSADLSPGDHTITARATDTDGLYDQTSFDITINQVPTEPTVTITPDPATTANTLTASASGSTDPDSSGTVTYGYAWYEDGILSSVSTTASFPSSDTQKNRTYRVVVTPSDGTGDGPTGEAERTIDNSDPVLTGPTLSASTVQVGDVLTCSATATDADPVDTPTVSYAWSDSSTGPTYAVTSSDDPGDTITCTATADDADGGVVTGTASATVDNTDPIIDSVSVSPSTGQVGDILTCAATATDDDGGTPTISYAWPDGSTAATYTIVDSDDPGDSITCTATATDSDGGTDTGTASATVTNTDPVMGTVSVSPSTGQVGDILTCAATGTDADGGTPTISYAWPDGSTTATYAIVDSDDPGDSITCTATATDSDGGTDTGTASATVTNTDPVMGTVSVSPSTGQVGDILTCAATGTDADGGTPTISYAWPDGSTAATYTIVDSDDPGDSITCTATATDSDGGTDTGTASATVTNTAPVIDSVSVSPSTGQVGDILTCAATATDDDGGTPTISYAWPDGSTAATYTIIDSDDPGDSITCTATATDSDGGTDTGTASATVTNTDPVMGTVSISPSSANNDDTLTCSASATDADGGTPTVTYAWSGSSAGSLGTGSSIDLSTTAVASAETVTCTATADDGDGGTDTGTATLTTANRNPTVSVTLSPSSGATRTDTLTCTASASDDDGDTMTTTFNWTVGGTTVSASSTASLSSTLAGAFVAGNLVACTATTTDGKGGSDTDTASTTITNTAPTVSTPSLSPSTVYTNNTLSVNATTSDAEGDTLTVTYDWYVDGSSVQDGADNTLSGVSYFDKDQTVFVIVTADDGTDTTSVTSSTVTVSNTAPTAPVVIIDPSDPVAGEDLYCEVTTASTDVDGDAITYSMSWTYDTTAYSGALTTTWTDDTADGADTVVDEVWECVATPNDGDDDGATASDSVTITQSCNDGSIALTASSVDFVEVCAGSFDMGCTAGQSSCVSDESPVMPVTLTRNYYVSQTEITQAQYQAVMGTAPSSFSACSSDCPVETVTWHMAADFANEMSANDGLTECYDCSGSGSSVSCDLAMAVYACDGYRLPTEAEWEGAARCGEDLLYAGSNTVGDVAWYSGNSSSTPHGVGNLSVVHANACGLSDMSGNVYEWTQDWYDGSYYTSSGGTDLAGVSSGTYRVLRGGGWSAGAAAQRVSNRSYRTPSSQESYIGIRLARTVDADHDGDGYLLSEDCDDTDVLSYDDNGASEDCAALSCKDIHDRGHSTGDGTYWIDPLGSGAFEAYCDMTSNDGGWTLIYSNYHAMGNSQHAGMFTSSSASHDQEYSTSDYTLSRARYEVGVSAFMFKQDISDSGTSTTAVYSGSSAVSALDIVGGTEYSYVSAYSDAYLPEGACTGMGTRDVNTMYIGKTGSGDRDYFFSNYDTDSVNTAGYFCWNQFHCTNNFGSSSGHIGYLLFADCNSPDQLGNDGYVEIFVRE